MKCGYFSIELEFVKSLFELNEYLTHNPQNIHLT